MKKIFATTIIFLNLVNGYAATDLHALLSNIPLTKSAQCLIRDEKTKFTRIDCIKNNSIFYNGKDETISYILGQYGDWPRSKITKLLKLTSVEQRYRFFVRNNSGPLTLECNTGLLPQNKTCSQPIFGNSQFQIDYLLCPNLAKNYFVLSSNNWTPKLDDIYTYCAANWQLIGQCQNAPIVLLTRPDALETKVRTKTNYTFTARELCQLLNMDRLKVKQIKNGARYNLYFLTRSMI